MKTTTKLASVATTIIVTIATSVLVLAPTATATVPTASKAFCEMSENTAIMNYAFSQLVKNGKASPTTCKIFSKSKGKANAFQAKSTGRVIVFGF
jgi:outer membrane lipoprotein-sorting protein